MINQGNSHSYTDKPDWGQDATFVPNKQLPIYNWFYYKEGFSRQLVLNIIEMLGLKEGNTVLDNFCGSGTTLLACKEMGIDAIGVDASELVVLASNVKVMNYNTEELKQQSSELFRKKFERLEQNCPSIVKKAFNRYALEDVVFFRHTIKNMKHRDFFLIALINAAMKVSYAWKDGGVIKIRKHPYPPLKHLYKRTVKKMIKELEKNNNKNAAATAYVGDARMLKMDDETVDGIITSPPYLNNIDYTKVYAIEEWISGLHEYPSVRSFIGLKNENIVECYFDDMKKVIEEMFRVLKKGGKAAIIVGNGYVNEIINSDERLAKIAEEIGLTIKEIIVLNKRYALEGRTEKKGILRESAIIMEKA